MFQYLFLGILNRRFLVLLAVLVMVGVFVSGFVFELAILNSQTIATALLADFLRYSLVLLMVLLITTNVAEDFELRQFERLLAMPIARWQYILAQVMIVASIALILVIPVVLILALYTSTGNVVYWVLALWLELFLVGLLAFLAILSLEKIPLAVFFSLAVYLLSKLSALISLMLQEAVRLSDNDLSNRILESIFNGILYILPGLDCFAQNDIFFRESESLALLAMQLQSVSIYAALIVSVCLVDFYRKEFNF